MQADRDALARQEAQARFERAQEQAELAAAVRRREIELEARREALRLEKLAGAAGRASRRLRAGTGPGSASRWPASWPATAGRCIQLGGSGDIADALVAGASMERPEAPEPPAGARTLAA